MKEWRKAWRSAQWLGVPTTKFINRSEFPLSPDIFRSVYAEIATKGDKGVITFLRLPSKARGVTERRWTIDLDFTFDENNLVMDPAQDLLVLARPSVASLVFQ